MQAVGVVLRINHVGNRDEVKTVLVAEVFPLQLPDAIPEDVGGTNGLGDKTQGFITQNLKRLACITDIHPLKRLTVEFGKPVKGSRAEIVVDTTVGKGLIGEVAFSYTQVVGGDRHGGEKPGKGTRRGNHFRNAGHLAWDVQEAIVLAVEFFVATLDVEAFAVKHGEHAVADIGGEDVEPRFFSQLKQAAVAVEELFVVVLKQSVGRQPIALPAAEFCEPSHDQLQWKTPHDVVADVKLHKADDLSGRLVKLLVSSGVAIPVEHEVCRENAAAGHRRDVADGVERPYIPHVADHTEMIERGPKATSREGETVMRHATGGVRTEVFEALPTRILPHKPHATQQRVCRDIE